MTLPYYARIMTAIGDTVFELVRFTKRRPCAPDWAYWLEGRENRCWVEQPIADCKCVSRRWRPPMSATAQYMRARRARE